MKYLKLLVFLALVGCATKPNPVLVKKLARVSLAASSQQYGLPPNNPEVRKLAKDNLDVSAESIRWGFPAFEGPASPEIGHAIQDALPPTLTASERVKVLVSASKSIP